MSEIEADPQHELRGVLDDWLAKVARDLQSDPSLGRRVDAMVAQVLADPATEQWLSSRRLRRARLAARPGRGPRGR